MYGSGERWGDRCMDQGVCGGGIGVWARGGVVGG